MKFKDIVKEEYLNGRDDITITYPPRDIDDYVATRKKIDTLYGELCPHCGCADIFTYYHTDCGLEDGWKFWKPLKHYIYGRFKCENCLMEWESPLFEYERFERCAE